jgi:hypothetical protein
MSKPVRLLPGYTAALDRLRKRAADQSPVPLSSGELGYKAGPRERVCLSCGAKPNADGTIPCGH